ncbi:MAG TPA: hypothetical protein VFE08_03310, partial [Candidatus Sulfotelmatobacter sp.]|nr:hypothetical protein [Candidatus Sulfotelmatobacter sp.]
GGAGGNHGNNDPEQLMGIGQAGGGKHCSAKREWEGKDGVLPLDHLKRHTEVAEEGHWKIVRQKRV